MKNNLATAGSSRTGSRRNLVVVGFSAKGLRLRRRTRNEEVRRESAGRRVQSHGLPFEMKNREMRGAARGQMNLVAGSRAERVVSKLEPFETGEGEPAVWLQKVCDMLRAPCGEVFFPRSLLRGCRRG